MRKTYVDVFAVHLADGEVRLKAIRVEDEIYPIDRMQQKVRAAATRVGGTGIRYTVSIRGRSVSLFDEENGKWFVEVPEP